MGSFVAYSSLISPFSTLVAGVTISYAVKKRKRIRHPPKAPEKWSALGVPVVPSGKKAIGLQLSIEYYDDDSQTATKWYKETVTGNTRKGYLVTFDGCGPEENETIKSLQQGVEKGEIKLL